MCKNMENEWEKEQSLNMSLKCSLGQVENLSSLASKGNGVSWKFLNMSPIFWPVFWKDYCLWE